MEIPPAAGPWLVLGVVLGLLVVALAALGVVLSRSRRAPAPAAPEPAGGSEDDLPGFLEFPPGTAPEPVTAGWTALSSPPTPPPPVVDAGDHGTGRLLAALGLTGLLLIGAAAAIAATRGPAAPAASGDHRAAPEDETPLPPVPEAPAPGEPGAGALAEAAVPPGREGMAADLVFGGVVLEPRAVGVTATYPELRVTAGSEGALAHLRLPTWNCLATEAPEDPVAAGCRPSLTEYADLPSPALTVTEDGDGWRVTGRFPTYTRPNGTPPVWTGRVYELSVTVDRRDGVLFLGDDSAETTGESVVTLPRSGD